MTPSSSSFRIATVAGVEIRVHVTFGLILLFGALPWGREHGAAGALFGALLMLLLFVCVVLHELGHSLVARHFDLPVREIILYPIGGVSRMQKNPRTPREELLVAIAGPLVNLVLACVLFAVLDLGPGRLTAAWIADALKSAPSLRTALVWLLSANVTLFVFNLVPAFPMDGGRLLRAFLALFVGSGRATRAAAIVGQSIAVAMGFFGAFTGNLILVFIAVFVFLGASQERLEEKARVVLGNVHVGDAYNKYALTLAPGDTLHHVVDYLLTSYQPDFAVVQGSKLLGVVTRQDVLAALGREEGDAYVTGIMKRDVLRVDARTPLGDVRHTLAEKGERVAAVYDGEKYLGLVSQEDIAEALIVVASRASQEERRRAAVTRGR